jgi:hypothetical protein
METEIDPEMMGPTGEDTPLTAAEPEIGLPEVEDTKGDPEKGLTLPGTAAEPDTTELLAPPEGTAGLEFTITEMLPLVWIGLKLEVELVSGLTLGGSNVIVTLERMTVVIVEPFAQISSNVRVELS